MVLLRKATNDIEAFAAQLALAVKLGRQWAELNNNPAFGVFLIERGGDQWFAYDRPDRIPDGAWVVETWVRRHRGWQLVAYEDWAIFAKGKDVD